MNKTSGSNASADPFAPDLTPVSDLDPADLLRQVTARVYVLWLADARVERERRRAEPGGLTYTPGGSPWRR